MHCAFETAKAKYKNMNMKYPPLAHVLNVWSLTNSATWGLDTSGGGSSWRKKVIWEKWLWDYVIPAHFLSHFLLAVCHDMNSLHHMLLPPWSEVFAHAVPKWTKILWNHEPKIIEVVSIRYYGNSNAKVTKTPNSSVFYTCSNDPKAATYWHICYMLGPALSYKIIPKCYFDPIRLQSDYELIQSNI